MFTIDCLWKCHSAFSAKFGNTIHEVQDEQWISTVAEFAADLIAHTDRSFVEKAIKALFHLRGCQILQKAVLERVWSEERVCKNATAIIDVILGGRWHQELADEACQAFCALHLQYSLNAFVKSKLQRPDPWKVWIDLADKSERSWCVEMVLHYALKAFANDVANEESSPVCPKFAIGQTHIDWGVQPLRMEYLAGLSVTVIVRYPDFWQTIIDAGSKHAEGMAETILLPLFTALRSLTLKVNDESLTAEDMLKGGTLDAWGKPELIDLLAREKCSASLEAKLDGMVKKVRFMMNFERAVNHHLPALCQSKKAHKADVKEAARILYFSFLKASNLWCNPAQEQIRIKDSFVKLAEVNAAVWSEVFCGDELQVQIDGAPPPSFCSLEAVIGTLHLASSGKHGPLKSMFQQTVQDLKAEQKANESAAAVLHNLFSLYKSLMGTFEELSKTDGELRPPVLHAIEKHWGKVSPRQLPQILADIQSVNSLIGRDLTSTHDRLLAILKGRQTAEFWKHCKTIQATLCGALSENGALSEKVMSDGFSEETERLAASLESLRSALGATGNNDIMKVEELDAVSTSTQRTEDLFDFLGRERYGFEQVFRLVTAMADVPGLSFLKALLLSVKEGIHLGTRLAEVVEGALTQETLASVEEASTLFLPLCLAVLSATGIKCGDPSRFEQMVGTWYSMETVREALNAKCQADVGALMLRLLLEVQQKTGPNFADHLEGLRSALRQGQVVQQKLEENSDDATAVSNTVHGMVSAGYLTLSPTPDGLGFEVQGVFNFSKGEEKIVRRDMQQLTECSDKASLAVPKTTTDDSLTALTPEKVQVFTGCVEGIIGLHQGLTQLLRIGHPYLQEKGELRFPKQGEGLSVSTLEELKEWLAWAKAATQQWCEALDDTREKHPVMSCIPARNITKVAEAILENQPQVLPQFMSLAVKTLGCFPPSPSLAHAFKQSKRHSPGENDRRDFLEQIANVLATQLGSGDSTFGFSPLHPIAREYLKSRSPDDATLKSRMERRIDPKFHPRRVLLIEEEASHEPGSSNLQGTAAVTVLSVLLPLGVGPGPDNVLLCDSATSKDDVSRFLQRVAHATRQANFHGREAQVLGLFAHVDCLQLDVLELLLFRVQAMQAAGGKWKDVAGGAAEIEARLVFTVRSGASKALIENLQKDVCNKQQINILKMSSIARFLKNAETVMGVHQVVMSDFPGDGKTHAIQKAAQWDQANHLTILWGGAQSRGQAARALKGACNAGCVHLELHSFEEGGGIDADMLLLELLLFRCVFDPERSEWARLAADTPLFIEVANSIKIGHGATSSPLMLLSAPILSCVPGQNKIDCNAPFTFAPADLDPNTASVSARNFALAGAALLLGDERRKLVGCQGDADVIFHLVADSAGTVVAKEHSDLLCLRSIDVQRAAQTALEEAWRKSQSAVANEDPPPVPSKATSMSFLTFLAHWTAKWVHHTFHFEQTFQHVGGVDIHGTLLPVLKEMIGMAAAMCLRSSAAEAQNQQLHKSKTREVGEEEDASLCEAMASRVLDARSSALTVWAFNTGGSLRFIGSSLELPTALKQLWNSLKRMQQSIPERMQQTIPEPPTDLSACSQESLRDLLLQVMSGHGLTTEKECCCSAFAIAGVVRGTCH